MIKVKDLYKVIDGEIVFETDGTAIQTADVYGGGADHVLRHVYCVVCVIFLGTPVGNRYHRVRRGGRGRKY